MRHRDAGDRDRGRDLVDPGIAEIAGDQAEQQPEREADQGRGNRKRHGIADRAQHFRQHRAAGGDGIAEIAVQRPPHPEPELNRQRPVEAVSRAHLRGELLRCIRRQHRDQGIAGRDVHQQEAHQRHAEHDRDDIDDASGDVDEHGSLFLLPFSPCGRRWRASCAPDEGFCPRTKSIDGDIHPTERTPHPSRMSFAHSIHPLPQGEREASRYRCPYGASDTGEKSTNQLFGCTKPLTFGLMARGETSWAT